MGVIAKYKFNQELYSDFIPQFNTEFTNYTITDEIDTDGYTIRTIESDSLPKAVTFGQQYNAENDDTTPKSLSLLEVYEMDLSAVTSIASIFRKCENLTAIHCQFNCNFDIVTDMGEVFRNCSSLISLDVSNFNTENVKNMSGMFQKCSSLTSLNVSNFNTKKVTSMSWMFQDCSSLTSLDVSNFNTEKVISMQGMFYNCSSLTSLDVSNFNTENVNNMYYMFYNCSSLISLDVSNFNTANVENIGSMFNNCSSITSLDVSNFNTEKVTNISNMFNNCSSLTSLDVSNFNTEKVEDMQSMFNNCSSLTSLDVSSFNTESVTTMQGMFYNCSLLTSLDVSHFNTNKVRNMVNIFTHCLSLNVINVSGWNTSEVTNMNGAFYDCQSLTVLDVSDWNTNKVTNMQSIFQKCSSLTTLDISNFNINNDINYINFLTECPSLKDIGLLYSSSDTINKTTENLNGFITIYYIDAKLEDLTKKSNITYKEYKMNILECDEEINLRRIDGVYDELNLETGELTQYISEVVLDGSENISLQAEFEEVNRYFLDIKTPNVARGKQLSNYLSFRVDFSGDYEHFYLDDNGNVMLFTKNKTITELQERLKQNNLTIQYQLTTPIIKTINLKNKPSINWQGDTYLHLENNTLYPQLDCEIESVNYYEIPKLKANTLYTLRYVGEPTQCIFGGLTYRTENNMILTSGSSDNLLYFDKEVRKVILIEGDVRDRNFDYFEGIESLGAVEIVTHKTNMPIFAKGGRK